MRPSGSPEELQRRRERVWSLLRQGYQPVEVAHRVGVDRRSVRCWKAAYRERGRKALRVKPVPGRPRKLDALALDWLERDLLDGARAAGFPTDLWTCRRIVQLIRCAVACNTRSPECGVCCAPWDGVPRNRSAGRWSATNGKSGAGSRKSGPALKKSQSAEGPSDLPRRNRLSDGPAGVSHLGSPQPHSRFLSTRRILSEGLLYRCTRRPSHPRATLLLLPAASRSQHQYRPSPQFPHPASPPLAGKSAGGLG